MNFARRFSSCVPSPTKPGLARISHNSAQVGQARLASGEGQGGGSPLAHAFVATPLPNPPPQGGREPAVLVESPRPDFTALNFSIRLPRDCASLPAAPAAPAT